MDGHVEEDIIKPKMPDKVVERLEGNIWEYERELEGFVGLFWFTHVNHMLPNKHPFVDLSIRSMGLYVFYMRICTYKLF